MFKTTRTTLLLLALLVLALLGPALAQPGTVSSQAASHDSADTDDLGFYLSTRLDALLFQKEPSVGEEPIRALVPLHQLYDQHGRSPLWLDGSRPTVAATAATNQLARSHEHGLDPEAYHSRAIVDLLETVRVEPTRTRLLDLELLLSDGLLHFAAHLLSGRVKAGRFDPVRNDFRHELDLIQVVTEAAHGDTSETLAELEPAALEYEHLKSALQRYRKITRQGGFVEIPDGPTLAPGAQASPARIEALIRRLHQSGDLATTQSLTATHYDTTLSNAVRRFQERHGLSADGKLGPATAAALAIPVSGRVSTIELSLERLRWLPRDLGRRHLRVNIPQYRLELVDDGKATLAMRVIVGRKDRPTAIFSDAVAYLVFYPYWEVPRTLAVEDELPKIQTDPSWVQKRNFEVLEGWDDHARTLDPAAIEWSALDRDQFPYRLRQRPGNGNALGRIKFMFPNAYDIYLHDTPNRQLFERADRSLSSGCIRLESPVELAGELLEGTPLWDRWRIDSVLAAGEQTTARLLQPIPIHLVYFTAWPDERGEIGFFEDVYQLDPGLRADLNR